MDPNVFTIEINEKFTRVGDLKFNGKTIELQALGYRESVPFYYSTENDQVVSREAEVIADLVSSLRIRKKNVNVIIPDAYTFSQILEMPQLKEKELLAAIRYQADEFIPMPIDDTVLDIEVLTENPKTKKLLLFIVACPKRVIEQIKKTLDKAKLVPENIENELSATGRLSNMIFKNSAAQAGTASILVNIGYAQSSLYLFDHATSLITALRTFKIGLELFTKEVKMNNNVDEQKAFESIRTMDMSGSPTILPVIEPGLKEFVSELERFILLVRENYNLNVTNIFLQNFDIFCPPLVSSLRSHFSVPISSFGLGSHLAANSVATSFAPYLSSFVSVIGGGLE